jgi:hypothetical protein
MGSIFKHILNPSELNDSEFIKNYLKFSFSKRKSKKSNRLYINICRIYNIYPKTIEELLDNIPNLGYHKDYFYILLFSRNSKLNNYIYNIVINKIKSDIRNLKNGNKISTLGKWLPRESSIINKKIKFIDIFNSKFFPDDSKFHARKKYRKLKHLLNNKLGTLETKMCAKEYDKINFEKVSNNALKKNMNALNKHEDCKNKIIELEKEQLKKKSLSDFIKQILSETHDPEMIERVWEFSKKRYLDEIPYLNKIISNSVGLFDLSRDTFKCDMQYLTIGVALLFDAFSESKILLFNDPNNKGTLAGTICDKVKKMMMSCGPCPTINLENYINLLTGDDNNKNLLIVSYKDEINFDCFKDKNMSSLHIQLNYDDNFNIIYFNGSKVKKLIKYEGPDERGQNSDNGIWKIQPKNIVNIINESNELNGFTYPIYLIMALFSFWLSIYLYDYIK